MTIAVLNSLHSNHYSSMNPETGVTMLFVYDMQQCIKG